MASPHAPKTRSRTWPSSSSSSSINKPHTSFFRIILPSILEEKQLKLPFKFVRRYGSDISSVAKLSLPNGNAWQVDVEKKRKEDGNKEEEIWLSKGWAEFMVHHSISIGFFLVFRYRGHSVFDVDIFNLTTCSIFYPQFENVGSSHIVISDEEDEKDDKFGGDEMEKSTLESLKASGIVTSYWLNRRIRQMYIKCRKGIEDAILVSDPAHPSFILVLNADESRGRDRPVIPISFARDYILKSAKNAANVVLQMEELGKQWTVEVGNDRRAKRCVSFGQGWRQFRGDNSLGEGDVCLFRLISSPEAEDDDPVFDVSIFPAQ
ncbi:B3 domain-containing protein At4g01580 [Linum grandiflorum]